ncbi:hypothetical protein L227DRAFT_617596 [Lentinus tigrinus ALCF2SS1-6]|uniref:Uncharacterized protein n=1 Tax=Lentinus tigrinus ALCF2SS1-6 TaxID=1328759 RepID=A0A5C2RM46_9APHY|nr:hypothetical protein L227DRAFT_617596 [Lentinus tigrinus ALCF2SS1-6]
MSFDGALCPPRPSVLPVLKGNDPVRGPPPHNEDPALPPPLHDDDTGDGDDDDDGREVIPTSLVSTTAPDLRKRKTPGPEEEGDAKRPKMSDTSGLPLIISGPIMRTLQGELHTLQWRQAPPNSVNLFGVVHGSQRDLAFFNGEGFTFPPADADEKLRALAIKSVKAFEALRQTVYVQHPEALVKALEKKKLPTAPSATGLLTDWPEHETVVFPALTITVVQGPPPATFLPVPPP